MTTTEPDQKKIDSAVAALVKALGYDEEDLAQVTIDPAGRVRVFTVDNGTRLYDTAKFKRRKPVNRYIHESDDE